MIESSINVRKTSYVYLQNNEITSSEEPIQTHIYNGREKLMKINVYKNNKDKFFELEPNKYELDETDNIITRNTSWFLLKPSEMDPKMNRYKLIPGEIIRIGRITMRIRDITFEEKKKKDNVNITSLNDSNNLNDRIDALKTEGLPINSVDNIKYDSNGKNVDLKTKVDGSEKIINITKKKELKKNLSIFSKIEKKNKVCRICYTEEEDEQKDPLIQPCVCDGSLKYIHLHCLKKWISTHNCIKLDSNEECAIFLIKPMECELCKTKFPDIIKHQNNLYPLLDFKSDFKSFLSLECLTLDKNKNKFIYVVSLEKNRKIKAGRGQECDIVLSDISVSRIHCYFIVDNKNVYLQDNDSKFTTLVFIQTPKIKLCQGLPLYIKIGGCSLDIQIKKNFSLFSCCEIAEKKSIFFYYNQNEKYIKDNSGLIVKSNEYESEENDYYYKSNNTQEIKKLDNNSNSIYIKEIDRMSDNEYLLLKNNKKKKDIKKGIFFDDVDDDGNDKSENEKTKDNKQENIKKENNDNNESNNNNIGSSINDNDKGEEENCHEEPNPNIDDNRNNSNNNVNSNNINGNDNNVEQNENLIENSSEEENENENVLRNENDSTNSEIA